MEATSPACDFDQLAPKMLLLIWLFSNGHYLFSEQVIEAPRSGAGEGQTRRRRPFRRYERAQSGA